MLTWFQFLGGNSTTREAGVSRESIVVALFDVSITDARAFGPTVGLLHHVEVAAWLSSYLSTCFLCASVDGEFSIKPS